MIAFVTRAWNILGESAAQCGRPEHGLSFACANVVVYHDGNGIFKASINASGDLGERPTLDVSLANRAKAVSFRSWAPNLSPNDRNGMIDTFYSNLEGLTSTRRISMAFDGNEANGSRACTYFCGPSSISGDGRFVVFSSWANNLVEGDDNEVPDVFLVDTALGVIELVSLARDGGVGDGASYTLDRGPWISGDGSLIAFMSTATNLVDKSVPLCSAPEPVGSDAAPACPQVYLYNRTSKATILISKDQQGIAGSRLSKNPQVTQDGSMVVFLTGAPNLLGGADLKEEQLVAVLAPFREPILLSLDPAGGPADSSVWRFSLAGDGTRVAFLTKAGNLGAAQDGNDKIFVYDFSTGKVRHVDPSIPDSGGADVHDLALSGDGNWLAIVTDSNSLAKGLPNGLRFQVYLVDLRLFLGGSL